MEQKFPSESQRPKNPPNPEPEKNRPMKPDVDPDHTRPKPGINDPDKTDPTRREDPRRIDPTRIDRQGQKKRKKRTTGSF